MGSEAKKACSTQADTDQRRLYHCTATLYTAKNLIPIRGRKRARYGTELQYRYVQLGQSHCIFCMGSALQLESTCNPSVGSRP